MSRWLTLRPSCIVAEQGARRLSVTTGDGRVLGFSAQSRPLLELLLEGIPESELSRICHHHPKISGIFLSMEEQGLTYLSPAPPLPKVIEKPGESKSFLSAEKQDHRIATAFFALISFQLTVTWCIHRIVTSASVPFAPAGSLWLGGFLLFAWIGTHEYAHLYSAKFLEVMGGKIHWISGRRVLPCFRAPEQGAMANPATKILIFLAGPLWDSLFLLAWGACLVKSGGTDSAVAFWLLICAASLGNALPSGHSDLGQACAAVKSRAEFRVSRILRGIYFWTFCGYASYTLLCTLKAGEKLAAQLLH